jgi:hypothetical protein
MPDPILPDPDDFEDSLRSAGVDPESFSLRDFNAWNDWADAHQDWRGFQDDYGTSIEGTVALWAAGMDPDTPWESMTIRADGDDWSVDITTADGFTYTIPIGEGYDIAWDIYDAADDMGIDIDKDIDTGESSEAS